MRRKEDLAWTLITCIGLCLVLFFADARAAKTPEWHPCRYVDLNGGCHCKDTRKIIYITENPTTRVRQLAHWMEGCARRKRGDFQHYYQLAYAYLHREKGPVKPVEDIQ